MTFFAKIIHTLKEKSNYKKTLELATKLKEYEYPNESVDYIHSLILNGKD
jgi:hypothetical protein